MIKVFRKIRYQLMAKNNTSRSTSQTGRYLKYALGEIGLVVIGILIALQINNWNEARKEKQFEYKILNDIKVSMEGNFWQLNMSINCNANAISSGEVIFKHLDEDLPYHDSLDLHFSRAIQFCVPTLRNAGYESLKSYGLNIIRNDSIRSGLDIYNNNWIEDLGARQEAYYANTVRTNLTELFDVVAMRTTMKPFDYESLKRSRKYRSILKTSMVNRKDQNNWYKEWLESFSALEQMLDRELEKR